MTITKGKWAYLFGVAAGIFPGSAAWAQAADAMNEVKVEEIVVTAQKRAESLQDVPIAITAMTGNMLASRGVSGTDVLSTAVPGLQLTRTYAFQTPFIRGIGSINSTPGDESATALYVDGVYRPSLSGGLFSFNSVARVEVLKGPQGTLFGRNAIGGVINIVTKNPQSTPSLDAEIGYGNYQTVEGTLYGTTGLADNLAADLGVYVKNQGKGFVKNVFNGKDVFKGKEVSIRSKIRWELGEGTDAILSVDYNRYEPDTGINTHAVGDALLLDGRPSPGYYKINTNFGPRAVIKQHGGSLTVNHDVDFARFVSISSYRKIDGLLNADQEGTPIAIVNIDQSNFQETYTQEFQLVSLPDSKIEWVGGFYYFNDKAGINPQILTGSISGSYPYLGLRDTLRAESFAVFGQATAPIFTDTRVTAGVRYTTDKRHIVGFNFTDPAALPPTGIIPNTSADQRETFSKLTYRFVLDHNFTDDVMAYASLSRGFKSGVYTTATPINPVVKPSVLDSYEIGFKTELFDHRVRFNGAAFLYKFRNIQLNTVSAGLSLLINAARSEVKGLDFDIDAAVTQHFKVQAGLSYLHGRFTDFPNAPSYVPRVNAAGVATGGNRLDPIPNARGYSTIQTPPITANVSAQYEIPTDIGTFNLSGTVYYNDGFYRNPNNRLREPSFTLVNAVIGWTSSSERYDIRVWGKNLLSQKYYSYATAGGVGDIGSPAPPLTFGATVGLHY